MAEVRNDKEASEDYTKEMINGKIYYMANGLYVHEMLIIGLRDEFIKYFIKTGNEKCKVSTEGLNFFMNEEDANNYVAPDIAIICDKKGVRRGYKGTPELIVEVASRDTRKKDRGDKFKLYEKAGVKEYWLVEPKLKSIEQYVLKAGEYDLNDIVSLPSKKELLELEDKKENYNSIIKLTIFEGLEIDLNNIFLKEYDDIEED
ncbi:MAG: Uma2 family endonuclease [Oscillospiraceae bacterium]|nr:Uma2 family endonuclease [Oscillospiraceae bacterium]